MRSFELRFQTEYDDGYSAGNGGTFTRIIAADDTPLAWHIGQGMLGEIVGDSLWLSSLIFISKTEKIPTIPCILPNNEVWKRVFQKLSFPLSKIRLIFSSNIGLAHGHVRRIDFDPNIINYSEPEVVGFTIWPPRN